MKRKLSLFCVIIIMISYIMSTTAVALEFKPPFEVNADSVYMVNLDTGNVVYEKNANKKVYPASLTKIMTAIVTLENIKDLQTEVEYKLYVQDIMSKLNHEYGGISLGGLIAGEKLSIEKLLYAALLPSANEAAAILADYIGDGSMEVFADMMNKKSKEIGAVNSHFVNPHGLFNKNHYTTAYDMFLMTKYALKNPTFKKMVSTTFYDGSPTNIHPSPRYPGKLYWNTTNKMMLTSSPYYYKGISGVKTGTLQECGRNFISTAKRNGYEYLTVVIGAPLEDENGEYYQTNKAFELTKKLYDWAFGTFRNKTIIEKNVEYNQVDVNMSKSSDQPFVKLKADKDFIALIPKDIDVSSVQIQHDIPKIVDAPIKEGQKIGKINLVLKGEKIGTVDLVATKDVGRSPLLYMINSFKLFFESFWFKLIFVFIVMSIIVYTGLSIVRYKNHKKYRKVKRRKKL